jgi:hypothetical protein
MMDLPASVMADSSKSVDWEQVSDSWWSSAMGYVEKKEGAWTAHVFHNQSSGTGWTESKRGFRTSVSARRWVESQGEK